jgi:hypothetical protein
MLYARRNSSMISVSTGEGGFHGNKSLTFTAKVKMFFNLIIFHIDEFFVIEFL